MLITVSPKIALTFKKSRRSIGAVFRLGASFYSVGQQEASFRGCCCYLGGGGEHRVLFFSPSPGRRRVLDQRGELLLSAGVANISEVQQRQRAKPQPRPGAGGQMECELWVRGKRAGGGGEEGG